MVQRMRWGVSGSGCTSRALVPDSEPIQITIPALDPDERGMLREIASRIRGLDTRNSVVDRTLQEIAAAVENTAGRSPEGAPI